MNFAIVTGAARGIGLTLTKALIGEGYTVIGIGRNQEALKQVQEKFNEKFIPISFDLAHPEKLGDLVSTLKKYAPIKVLVNNAGIEVTRCYEDYSFTELQSIILINLLAPMELTRRLIPMMIPHNGNIIQLCSLAGKKGTIYNAPYSASKAGLIMLTDALRQEFHHSSLNFTNICPGYVSESGMFFNSGSLPPAFLGTSTPQDVANALLKAIKEAPAEILVNKGPMRPLLALNQIFPQLGDWIVRLMGIPKMYKERMKSNAT